MSTVIAGIEIPDTRATVEATALIAAQGEPLLVEHSHRVFLFGTLLARQRGLEPDPELLYLASMFHDSGLLAPYSDLVQRFELDGADRARAFLVAHGFPEPAASEVWEAIALHTTPEVPGRLGPVIAATNAGVLTDAIGVGLDELDPGAVAEITAAHPRGDFKHVFPELFHRGLRHRPGTVYGTVNADVLAHFEPGYRRGDMIERITGSAWPS